MMCMWSEAPGNGKELLLPAIKDCIRDVDLESGDDDSTDF